MKKLVFLALTLALSGCSSPLISLFETKKSFEIVIKSPAFLKSPGQGSRLLTPDMAGDMVSLKITRLDMMKVINSQDLRLVPDQNGVVKAQSTFEVPVNVMLRVTAEVSSGGYVLVRGQQDLSIPSTGALVQKSLPLLPTEENPLVTKMNGGTTYNITVPNNGSRILAYTLNEASLNHTIYINWANQSNLPDMLASLWGPGGEVLSGSYPNNDPNQGISFIPQSTGTYYVVLHNPEAQPGDLDSIISSISSPLHLAYNGNGAVEGEPPTYSNYTAGESVSLFHPDLLSRYGYLFKEWNTKSDGTGQGYFPGDSLSFGTNNIILYAIWSPSAEVQMVSVEGGKFQRDGVSKNITEVSSYLMSRYDVTYNQYNSVMGLGAGTNLPVIATWYQAVAFCNKLSLRDGLKPVYTVQGISNWRDFDPKTVPSTADSNWNNTSMDLSADGYRLPTVMEYMWASMGGKRDSVPDAFNGDINTTGYLKGYPGSSEAAGAQSNIAKYVWNSANSGSSFHAVGAKLPNELGLYDLSGNAWKWCWDTGLTYPSGSLVNYHTPSGSGTRVLKSGSYSDNSNNNKIAAGVAFSAQVHTGVRGFRILRSPKSLYTLTYTALASTGSGFIEAYEPMTAAEIRGNAASLSKTADRFIGWTENSEILDPFYRPGENLTMEAKDRVFNPVWITREGLVGEFLFTGDAVDTSVKNYTAVVTGPSLTTDRKGTDHSAYFFPKGQSSENNITVNTPILPGTTVDSFTISMWIKSYDINQRQMLFIQTTGSNSNSNLDIRLEGGKVHFEVFPQLAYKNILSNSSLESNKWYHLAVVKNGADAGIYINGKLDVWSTGFTSYTGQAVIYTTIGQNGKALDHNWDYYGDLDDFRIYDKPLTSTEVLSLSLE